MEPFTTGPGHAGIHFGLESYFIIGSLFFLMTMSPQLRIHQMYEIDWKNGIFLPEEAAEGRNWCVSALRLLPVLGKRLV